MPSKEPFASFINDGYKHLKQIYLKGASKNIIADDLFVKMVRDEDGVNRFRAILSDSKLTNNSPWTDNQLSELIDVFRKNPNKKYIEFEVRSSAEQLRDFDLPKDFNTGRNVRIYREDVFKVISDGQGNFSEILKMF